MSLNFVTAIKYRAIKLTCDRAGARARRQVNNFGDEIEKPQHIEQAKQCVSHRLQRLVVPQPRKHLPRKNS